ncbi:MAG: ornithine acetyltransferase [Candidatus Omnitrophica bacterium CG08_land_8_20_14_0_20_41_16]|uniref:Arginine biosynthesis bifunctional protein ArgJ n=1 Tax=Candidatus Sherwoodlollariibacterium unditelluris TaxID=1974757 RepID=A0A2G9YKP7_9BACT|nr:MAG: bifunctional ornithine acetyltransferase/N-acetylglutamate synthase [Candidatus Omnitrophica bacterium CG23_combo_of_CG06-09_8_20_14_all_41_10]PIS33389.1 MAG: ornithine acetyltransferase [Candidatus Omnitrophica bacterium CG08_land_8_20_14_0_20_41_16]
MRVYKKAILPFGFKASGISCGIKKFGNLDLALFYSDTPAKAACKFTMNKIQAAPIKINKRYLKANKEFQAIIINSGNANCFNAGQGLKDAKDVTDKTAEILGIKNESVLAASTGIIARKLPVAKITSGIKELVAKLSCQGINEAKKAILTTDTFTKEITIKCGIGGKVVTLCGIAKGAGMIAPDMATLLAFIFTDADLTKNALNKALKEAVDKSFNCITVDGCMSTNDSVMLLANGKAKNARINTGKNLKLFKDALTTVCLKLAKMIVRDAEGASKFVQIKVSKAKNPMQARKAALAIANSNLFKIAIYGENPNFGRIVAAVGASGVDVLERSLKIKVSPLKGQDIFVDVALGRGSSSATVYTSDLTPKYIKINAEYN